MSRKATRLSAGDLGDRSNSCRGSAQSLAAKGIFDAFQFKITAFDEADRSLLGSESLWEKHRERQIANHHSIFGGDKLIGVHASLNIRGDVSPCS